MSDTGNIRRLLGYEGQAQNQQDKGEARTINDIIDKAARATYDAGYRYVNEQRALAAANAPMPAPLPVETPTPQTPVTPLETIANAPVPTPQPNTAGNFEFNLGPLVVNQSTPILGGIGSSIQEAFNPPSEVGTPFSATGTPERTVQNLQDTSGQVADIYKDAYAKSHAQMAQGDYLGALGTSLGSAVSGGLMTGVLGGLGGSARDLPVIGGAYRGAEAALSIAQKPFMSVTMPLAAIAVQQGYLPKFQDAGNAIEQVRQGNYKEAALDINKFNFGLPGSPAALLHQQLARANGEPNILMDAGQQVGALVRSGAPIQDIAFATTRLLGTEGSEYFQSLDPITQFVSGFIFDPLTILPGLHLGEANRLARIAEATVDLPGKFVRDESILVKGRLLTEESALKETGKSAGYNFMLRTEFEHDPRTYFARARKLTTAIEDLNTAGDVIGAETGMKTVLTRRTIALLQDFGDTVGKYEKLHFKMLELADQHITTGAEIEKLPKPLQLAYKNFTSGTIDAKELLRATKTMVNHDAAELMGKTLENLFPIPPRTPPMHVITGALNALRAAESLLFVGLSPFTWVRNIINNKATMLMEGINPFENWEGRIKILKDTGRNAEAVEMADALHIQRQMAGVGGYESISSILGQSMGGSTFGTGLTGSVDGFMYNVIKSPLGAGLRLYSNLERMDRLNARMGGWWKGMQNWRKGKWIPDMPLATQAHLANLGLEADDIINVVRDAGLVGGHKEDILHAVEDFLNGRGPKPIDFQWVADDLQRLTGTPYTAEYVQASMGQATWQRAMEMLKEAHNRIKAGEEPRIVWNEVSADAHFDNLAGLAGKNVQDLDAMYAALKRESIKVEQQMEELWAQREAWARPKKGAEWSALQTKVAQNAQRMDQLDEFMGNIINEKGNRAGVDIFGEGYDQSTPNTGVPFEGDQNFPNYKTRQPGVPPADPLRTQVQPSLGGPKASWRQKLKNKVGFSGEAGTEPGVPSQPMPTYRNNYLQYDVPTLQSKIRFLEGRPPVIYQESLRRINQFFHHLEPAASEFGFNKAQNTINGFAPAELAKLSSTELAKKLGDAGLQHSSSLEELSQALMLREIRSMVDRWRSKGSSLPDDIAKMMRENAHYTISDLRETGGAHLSGKWSTADEWFDSVVHADAFIKEFDQYHEGLNFRELAEHKPTLLNKRGKPIAGWTDIFQYRRDKGLTGIVEPRVAGSRTSAAFKRRYPKTKIPPAGGAEEIPLATLESRRIGGFNPQSGVDLPPKRSGVYAMELDEIDATFVEEKPLVPLQNDYPFYETESRPGPNVELTDAGKNKYGHIARLYEDGVDTAGGKAYGIEILDASNEVVSGLHELPQDVAQILFNDVKERVYSQFGKKSSAIERGVQRSKLGIGAETPERTAYIEQRAPEIRRTTEIYNPIAEQMRGASETTKKIKHTFDMTMDEARVKAAAEYDAVHYQELKHGPSKNPLNEPVISQGIPQEAFKQVHSVPFPPDGLTRAEFVKQSYNAFRSHMSKAEFDASMQVLDTRARAWVSEGTGRTIDGFYDQFAKVRRTVGASDERFAQVSFMADGRAIIDSFKQGTPTTFLHETAHVFINTLDPVDFERLRKLYKFKPGEYEALHERVLRNVLDGKSPDGLRYSEMQEGFAYDFERYLRGGRAPTPELEGVFANFKKWVEAIYKKLHAVPGYDTTPEMQDFFDSILREKKVAKPSLVDVPRTPALKVIREASNARLDELKGAFSRASTKEQKAYYARQISAMEKKLGIEPPVEAATPATGGAGQVPPTPPGEPPLPPLPPDELPLAPLPPTDPIDALMARINELSKVRGQGVMIELQQLREQLAELLKNQDQANRPSLGFEEMSSDELWNMSHNATLPDPDAAAAMHLSEQAKAEAAFNADFIRVVKEHYQDLPISNARASQAAVKDVMGWVRKSVFDHYDDAHLAAGMHADWMEAATVLNYDRRYKFDNAAALYTPFPFWKIHYGIETMRRFLDNPALLSFYIHAHDSLDQVRHDPRYPKRLWGRTDIAMPFSPDFMKGGMFYNPLDLIIPLEQVFGADSAYNTGNQPDDTDVANAIRGMINTGEITASAGSNAIANGDKSPLYASIKARMVDHSQSGQLDDSLGGLFRPHLPFDVIFKLLTGQEKNIGTMFPITRLIKGATTLSPKGSFLNPTGMGTNIEAPIKQTINDLTGHDIPLWDAYEDQRVDKSLADLVGEGKITADQALVAMIERKGPIFDQGQQRANDVQRVQAFSLGGLVFPEGERNYYLARIVRDEAVASETQRLGGDANWTMDQKWDFLRQQSATGSGSLIQRIYEKYPVLGSHGDIYKEPESRLKSAMTDGIWETINGLSKLDARLAGNQLGKEFQDNFRNKDTRDMSKVTLEQLVEWSQRIHSYVPQSPITPPGQPNPKFAEYATPDQSQRYQDYLTDRNTYFNMTELGPALDRYHTLDLQGQRAMKASSPILAAYLAHYGRWAKANPDIAALLNPDFKPFPPSRSLFNSQIDLIRGAKRQNDQFIGLRGPLGGGWPGHHVGAKRGGFGGGQRQAAPFDFSILPPSVMQALEAKWTSGTFIPKPMFTQLLTLWRQYGGGLNFTAWLNALRDQRFSQPA